jgi:hypothetical protein
MNIFPNPSKDYVTIEIETRNKGMLCIYDTLGKQVNTYKINPGSQRIKWQNPVRSSSVYYVKLTDLKGNVLENNKVVFE